MLAPLFLPADLAADEHDAWAAANIRLRQHRDEINEHHRIANLIAEIRAEADAAGYL